jgi:hypothetical protein
LIKDYLTWIIVKIYPKGNRFDSSNVDPIKFWNHGFQIGEKS